MAIFILFFVVFICHVRHINPVKIHPERFTQKDKELFSGLNYDGIEFSVDKENLQRRSEKKGVRNERNKTMFALMCFVMKTS